MALTVDALGEIPRLGWVTTPTPVEPVVGSGGAIWVKRDDLLAALLGGAKPRKLDYLLARSPYRDASTWHAVGAIGSGQLVAVAEAARTGGRKLVAHTFWEPLGGEVRDNLAYTATHAQRLTFSRNRLLLAARHPRLLVGPTDAAAPAIAPGVTDAVGMLGAVHLGLELAEQFRSAAAPTPRRVYVPLGTGGLAVGLSVGLALGGADTEVRAVAVVERLFATRRRLRALRRDVLAELARWGISSGDAPAAVPIGIDRTQLGRGYGARTHAALDACAHFEARGLLLEPVYGGKAAAALLADLAPGSEIGADQPVMLLCTAHRQTPAVDEGWRDRLPKKLRRRLVRAGAERGGISRRAVLVGGAATAVGAAALVRGGCYPALEHWQGRSLTRMEAHVLLAWAAALLPPAPDDGCYRRIAEAVDRYVARLPSAMRLEIHGMFMLLEHGTPLGLQLSRVTDLSVSDRVAFFRRVTAMGGVLAQATRGMRDLVFMGYYQQPESWAALGYEGPRVPPDAHPSGPGRMEWPAYDGQRAPRGQHPRGWQP